MTGQRIKIVIDGQTQRSVASGEDGEVIGGSLDAWGTEDNSIWCHPKMGSVPLYSSK